MDKKTIEEKAKKYSPIVINIYNNNIKYYNLNQNIKILFCWDEDESIVATCNRDTNNITINLKSVERSEKEDNYLTIEYFMLHEVRHAFQHIAVKDLMNNEMDYLDKKIVEKWKYEFDNYISVKNQDGSINKQYFFQDSEIDAYAFSYAVMKNKYDDVTSNLYVPEYNTEIFWRIVNEWIEQFKQQNEK